MIDISSATLGYGDNNVIDKLSLTFEKNKRYAIIGPSGCGKTTLLYGIAGIVNPVDGQITIMGEIIKQSRQETSMILQSYGLFPWKTVWQNIMLPLIIRKDLSETKRFEGERLLRTLGLWEKRMAYPSELSGGQKQRVAIARSWITGPDLLLMDEPFSSLDAMTREGLQETLLRLQQESNMTLIMVTHSIEEAVYMAQKIIVMSHCGSIASIIDNSHQGAINFRESTHFYELCIMLRSLLKGAHDET